LPRIRASGAARLIRRAARSSLRLPAQTVADVAGVRLRRGGGFFDSGNFLRIEDSNHFVLMEADGPGCIDRMWFTYKSQVGGEPYDLLIFLDDGDRRSLELISMKSSPAGAALRCPAGGPLRQQQVSGTLFIRAHSFSRILQGRPGPDGPKEQYQYRANSFGQQIPHIYYQITYRRFPPDTPVKRFAWDLSLPNPTP